MMIRVWGFAKRAFHVLVAIGAILEIVSLGRNLYELASRGALEDIDMPTVPWVIIIALAILVVLMLQGALLSGRAGNRAVAREARRLSEEILTFAVQRRREDPSVGTPIYFLEKDEEKKKQLFYEDVNQSSAYSRETMAQYISQFLSRVIWLREELAKRGVSDKQFDSFYQHPTNILGVESVGMRLGAMAHKLR